MYILLSLSAVAVLLVANELRWRRTKVHKEHSRKIVHILVGSFVAFWPYYLSWDQIRVISLAFLVGVGLSKMLNIFASIHEVDRFSVGEVCFALAVGTLTYITRVHWIYTASLLQMSVADGIAAIVGVHYGRKNRYKVFGSTKSLIGTATFFVSSLAILVIAGKLSGAGMAIWLLVAASLIATGVENVAVYGLDDLLLPVIVSVILTRV